MLQQLLKLMMEYYRGDPKRIQHFVKVHALAKLIGECENLKSKDQFILEAAAIVHDVGIKICEEKYGECSGKLQEKEGPELARRILASLDFDRDEIDRVAFLVGHHHTYDEIKGADYRILVESDFLVNLYEDQVDEAGIKAAYETIFRTPTGKKLCEDMYGL